MRWLFAACVALALVAPAAGASAQDADAKARAKEAFQQGVAAFEAKRYEEALVHFEEAQRLAPHPIVQVNLANCHDKLERPIQAIEHFEAFLASGQAKAEQREEVTAALRRLRGKIGRLLLDVQPEGAEVRIDGGAVMRAPIAAPVLLATGTHTLEVTHPGYTPVTRQVELGAGAVDKLDVRLEPATAAPPPVAAAAPVAAAPAAPAEAPAVEPAPAPAPAPEARESGGLSTAVWVSGGVTSVFLVAATVTGLLALGAETEFEDQRSLRFSTAPELTASQRLAAYRAALDAADRAHAFALATDVLLGAAVVGAGVTVYLYLTDRERDSAVLVAPAFAADGAGATLQGHW